ncbi:glycogen synthase [Patescibacteria group bacterium]
MNVLFAVWELAPFFKVGGLGDVARSLPRSLKTKGVDIRVVLPYYKAISLNGQKKISVGKFSVKYDGKNVPIEVYKICFIDSSIPVYLIKNTKYLNIPIADTYALFDLAVCELATTGISKWKPDIVHGNDSHCGLIPLLIKERKIPVKTMFTIHNMQYQNRCPLSIISKIGLDEKCCNVFHWESSRRKINFLLEGMLHADIVNTVSPTYAKEIFTEEFSAGLDDVINEKNVKVIGILNGIDYEIRNPKIDPFIPYNYALSCKKTISGSKTLYPYEIGKTKNKKYLQRLLGFRVNENIPVTGFIGRFNTHQKGIDLIHKMLLRADLSGLQFVIMGEGDPGWHEKFEWLRKFNPKNIYVSNRFDEKMASLIYAASDFLFIPSKFEPCGLIQMIAMRYGCVPIAHAVGGLKDTIAHNKDGFLFHRPTSHALEKQYMEAVDIRNNKPKTFNNIIKNAMLKDFSWKISASKYIEVYKKMLY